MRYTGLYSKSNNGCLAKKYFRSVIASQNLFSYCGNSIEQL